jgi:GNAT superfamily N-acetyltransferase
VAEEGARSVTIRAPAADEGGRLKEIAISSKAFWGYELDKVREWADRGDFSSEHLGKLTVFVAEAEARAIGWSSLDPRGEVWWLADLWIEPAWIGKGVGGRLFRHGARHAQRVGAKRLEWEAEPNSIGFYERMGARHLRDSEQTEWGRTLSVMGVELNG